MCEDSLRKQLNIFGGGEGGRSGWRRLDATWFRNSESMTAQCQSPAQLEEGDWPKVVPEPHQTRPDWVDAGRVLPELVEFAQKYLKLQSGWRARQHRPNSGPRFTDGRKRSPLRACACVCP